ncbi:hypothetical protein [Agrilutibacter solisilvae]|uniref:Uncharacterized protein n=1 Tax=Agrilutibacter solisilvae TaxID=2763317 RepID=A0A974XW83_9GAMM|nr:hypothetical protein [Lysobacter solisilvae]QSX77036.1 hypothetical protein I8J32_009465 [Lysobacter solisilvae]
MKQPVQKALLLTFAVALTGCAGMDARSTYVDPSDVSSPEYRNNLYVTRVESIARQKGIDVVWVNPPRIAKKQKVEPR